MRYIVPGLVTALPPPNRPQRGRLAHAAAVGPPVVRQSSVPAGPRAPLLGRARCFGTDRQPAAAEGQGRQATRLGPGAPPSLRRVAQRGRGAVTDMWSTAAAAKLDGPIDAAPAAKN